MPKFNRILTLEKIANSYNIIIIDNCALKSFIKEGSETYVDSEEQIKYYNVFLKYLKQGLPCYITSKIAEEIKDSPKKENRKNKDKVKKRINSEKNLINDFYGREKVIKLKFNEKELYKKFFNEYKKLPSAKRLSETNFDFLINGMVIQIKEKCALISNNMRIFYLWKDVTRKEKIFPEDLGFFCREGLDKFKQLIRY